MFSGTDLNMLCLNDKYEKSYAHYSDNDKMLNFQSMHKDFLVVRQ